VPVGLEVVDEEVPCLIWFVHRPAPHHPV
jgi:hypothetical protein